MAKGTKWPEGSVQQLWPQVGETGKHDIVYGSSSETDKEVLRQTGRVSPRNSSRGGNDNGSKKSASPIHSSPLHKEVNGKDPSILGRVTDTDLNFNSMPRSVPNPELTNGSAPSTDTTKSHIPPPSQPLLEGGAPGSSMPAIQEEREISM